MPGKHRRRRYSKINLAEVSAVDVPAQPLALADFQKRKLDVDVEKALLTSATEGHTHLLTDMDGKGQLTNGSTSYEHVPGTDSMHSHPWVRTSGGIVIGEAAGHTHTVAAMSVAKNNNTEGDPMPDENKDTAKAAEAQETVLYKSLDGVECRTPGEVMLAKRLDNEIIEKRANAEFPSIVAKGDDGAGMKLVRKTLLDGDEDALAGLKAIETSLAATTQTALGKVGAAGASTEEPDTEGGTHDEFVKAAVEWGKDLGLDAETAQMEFAKTADAQRFFAQALPTGTAE